MKSPVLIAAHNESESIGRLLDRLDPSVCEPLVIVNGSNDDTAQTARGYGVHVIDREEQGKLPALQAGLRLLGSRALDPVLFIDADSYPINPHGWVQSMASATMHDVSRPGIASGRLAFVDDNPVSNRLRSLKSAYRFRRDAKSYPMGTISGANMAIRPKDADVLDAIIGLPHMWPHEDKVIARTVLDFGGLLVHDGTKAASVATSSRYSKPLYMKLVGKGGALVTHEERIPTHAQLTEVDSDFRPISL